MNESLNAMGEPVQQIPFQEVNPEGSKVVDETAAKVLRYTQEQAQQQQQQQLEQQGVVKAGLIQAQEQDQKRQEIIAQQQQMQTERLNMTAAALQDVRNYGKIRPEIEAQLNALKMTASDVDTLYKTNAAVDPYETKTKALESEAKQASIAQMQRAQEMYQKGVQSGDADLIDTGLQLMGQKVYDEHLAAKASLNATLDTSVKSKLESVELKNKITDEELSKQANASDSILSLPPEQQPAMYQIVKGQFGPDAPAEFDQKFVTQHRLAAISATRDHELQKAYIERGAAYGAPGSVPIQGTVEQSIRGAGRIGGDIIKGIGDSLGGAQVDISQAASQNQSVVKPVEAPNIIGKEVPQELHGITTKSGAQVTSKDVRDLVNKAKEMGNDKFTEEDAKKILIKHLGKK